MSGPPARPVVLVLASGLGRRFLASGGQGNKLDAELGGRTVLQRTLEQVRASGLPFHVVRGGFPSMGESIAAGVAATASAPGWLILPGDLPLVSPGTLLAVAGALERAEVVVPVHAGQPGHPVGFAASCGGDLRGLRDCDGARAVVCRRGALRLEATDAGCVADIDTVEDLERLRKLITGLGHRRTS